MENQNELIGAAGGAAVGFAVGGPIGAAAGALVGWFVGPMVLGAIKQDDEFTCVDRYPDGEKMSKPARDIVKVKNASVIPQALTLATAFDTLATGFENGTYPDPEGTYAPQPIRGKCYRQAAKALRDHATSLGWKGV